MTSEHLQYYFKLVHESIVSYANKQLKRLDITSSQMDILFYLFANEDKENTQRDIEKHYSLSHSTVIGLLQRLKEKGYITVSQSESDKRQRIVRITKKGELLKDEVIFEKERWEKILEESLGKDKIELLAETVKEMYDIIQKEIENDKKAK